VNSAPPPQKKKYPPIGNLSSAPFPYSLPHVALATQDARSRDGRRWRGAVCAPYVLPADWSLPWREPRLSHWRKRQPRWTRLHRRGLATSSGEDDGAGADIAALHCCERVGASVHRTCTRPHRAVRDRALADVGSTSSTRPSFLELNGIPCPRPPPPPPPPPTPAAAPPPCTPAGRADAASVYGYTGTL